MCMYLDITVFMDAQRFKFPITEVPSQDVESAY